MSSHDKAASHLEVNSTQPRARRVWHTPVVIVGEMEDTFKIPFANDIITPAGVLGPAS